LVSFACAGRAARANCRNAGENAPRGDIEPSLGLPLAPTVCHSPVIADGKSRRSPTRRAALSSYPA
jgi:hypothetical protein